MLSVFQLTQLAASLYGYRPSYPQPFPQQPVLPLPRFYLWPQQMPVHQAAKVLQHKLRQIPVTKQPLHRPQPRPRSPQQPHKPIQQPQPRIQQLPKQHRNANPVGPPQTHPQVPVQQPKGGKQQQPRQAFPPNQQYPWHFQQIFGQGRFQPFGPYQHMPAGVGRPRPPTSEEGVNTTPHITGIIWANPCIRLLGRGQ
ncbi:uncharacterized protein LOC128343665 [Hemicordylus capensis]|uniref:uncharacterized protein LOC128343665 n=1 Tax=Hemicordylus capensis TaxID=884348 RepID=UPI002304298A|nr:uncharacterized protein LOC128343665 [Hemicordylus capensis]